MQFQILTPTPSAPLKQSPGTETNPSGPSGRRDSTFLVLTPEPAQASVPERRGSTFLVLTSDAYPTRRQVATTMAPSEASISPTASPLLGPTEGVIATEFRTRRSTSVSSTGSSTDGKKRFLKLNANHWNEDGEDDYVIEE